MAMLGGRTTSLYIFRALVACTWILFLLPSYVYVVVPFVFWCVTIAIQKSYQTVVIYDMVSSSSSSSSSTTTTTTMPTRRENGDTTSTHSSSSTSSRNDPSTSTGNGKHHYSTTKNNNNHTTLKGGVVAGGGEAYGVPGSSSLFRLVGYSVYFDKNALLSLLACYAGTIMWISALVLLVFSYVNVKEDYSSTRDGDNGGDGSGKGSGSYLNAYLDTLEMFIGFSSSSSPSSLAGPGDLTTSSTSHSLPSPPFSLTGAHELQFPFIMWGPRWKLLPTTSINAINASSSNCRADCFSLPLALESLIPNMWLLGEYYSVFPITSILEFIYEHLLSQKRNIVETKARKKESSYLYQQKQDNDDDATIHSNNNHNNNTNDEEDEATTTTTTTTSLMRTTTTTMSTSNSSTGSRAGHRVEKDFNGLGSTEDIHSSSSSSSFSSTNILALRDRALHQLFSMLSCWSVLLALILSIISVLVYRARPVPSVFQNASQQFRLKVEHIHKTREYWKERLFRKKNIPTGTNPSSSSFFPASSTSTSFSPSSVLLITREEYILKQFICLLLWLLISLLVVILLMSPRALTGGAGRGDHQTKYHHEWKKGPSMMITLFFPLLGALVALHGMMKLLQWKWSLSCSHREEEEDKKKKKNHHSKISPEKNPPLQQKKLEEEKQGKEEEKKKKATTTTEEVGVATSSTGKKINPSAPAAAVSHELKMTLLDAAVQGQPLPISLWCSPTRIHDRTDGWWMASLLLAVGLSLCPFFSVIQLASSSSSSSFSTSPSHPMQISNMNMTRSTALPVILEMYWWKGCMMGGVFLWWCMELYYILFPHYDQHHPSASASDDNGVGGAAAGAAGLRTQVQQRWWSSFSSPFSCILEVVPLFLVVAGTVGMWIFSSLRGKEVISAATTVGGGAREGKNGGIISFVPPSGDSSASSFYSTSGGVIGELMNYYIFPAACIFFLAMLRFSYRLWILCFEPEEMWMDHP